MNPEEKLYELKMKMNWLIDGYSVNCVLPHIAGKFILPVEWIVENYNVDISYFRKK